MVLLHKADEARHPYWYMQIIWIFHVEVWNYDNASMTKPCQMNLLFVHWFSRDPTYKSGFSAKLLPRIGFLKGKDPCAFGFIDPNVIIQGIHLIPVFEHGQTDQLLTDSFVLALFLCKHVSLQYQSTGQLARASLSRFVDKDMFMCYWGGSIGHKISRGWDKFLQADGAEVSVVAEEEDGDMKLDDEEDDTDEEDKDQEDEEEDEEEDDKEDRIEADKGEELDDNILAEEGYGAL
ncbi:hypothetical protein BDR05DRAFT_895158 [Suillus weaverae]|nr:hypothetical protein BDR05DRAFT_895158 [Suillus weaverae]